MSSLVPSMLPAQLRAIYAQLDPLPEVTTGRDDAGWQQFIEEVGNTLDNVTLVDEGEVLYTGAPSPGCEACRNGGWDCVFVTMRCNLNCAFCCSPQHAPPDIPGLALGHTPEQAAANHRVAQITGVSFSGGEPFTDKPRLFELIAQFRKHSPAQYTWVYTNGVLVTEDDLCRLRDLGVDEIRFDLAATGYTNAKILNTICAAAGLLSNITVEIPTLPGDERTLIAALKVWDDSGVRFLNLHELMHEPGTNAAHLPGERLEIVLNDGHMAIINPRSRWAILNVMRHIQREGLRLSVNCCSLRTKVRQTRGRRRGLARLLMQPHEKLVDDTYYETHCAYRGAHVVYLHPDSRETARPHDSDYTHLRLVRTAPLALDDPGRWVRMERIR